MRGGGRGGGGAERRGQGAGLQGEGEGGRTWTLLPCLSLGRTGVEVEALSQSSSASTPRGTPQVNREGRLMLSIANPGHTRRSREGSFRGLPHPSSGTPEPAGLS